MAGMVLSNPRQLATLAFPFGLSGATTLFTVHRRIEEAGLLCALCSVLPSQRIDVPRFAQIMADNNPDRFHIF